MNINDGNLTIKLKIFIKLLLAINVRHSRSSEVMKLFIVRNQTNSYFCFCITDI